MQSNSQVIAKIYSIGASWGNYGDNVCTVIWDGYLFLLALFGAKSVLSIRFNLQFCRYQYASGFGGNQNKLPCYLSGVFQL